MPSLRSCVPFVITCLLVIPTFRGTGCGPFFPENILDEPRGILRPPAFDFISEFRKLKHPALKNGVTGRPIGSPAYTLDLEMQEMAVIMRDRITDEGVRTAWLGNYRGLRAGMLESTDKSEYPLRSEDLDKVFEGRKRAAARQWPQELPDDVKLYLEGAMSYAEKDVDAARAAWKKLLGLPADQRRWRSTWAAWMLFRACPEGATSEQEPWLKKTRALAAEGFADCLNLGVESTYILYRVHEGNASSVSQLEWQHASCARAVLGHSRSDMEVADDAEWMRFATGAQADAILADSYLRRILLLSLLKSSSAVHLFYGKVDQTTDAKSDTDTWLERIEKLDLRDQQEATLLAWAAYNNAQFDLTRRWLKLAPSDDTKAQWIRGKLAAMRGDSTEAERLFKLAAKPALAKPRDEARCNMESDAQDNVDPLTDANYEDVQKHYVLASLGVSQLANNRFMNALRTFERSDYWLDTAYIAERLVPLEDLLTFTRKSFPNPAPHPQNPSENKDQPQAPVDGDAALTLSRIRDQWNGVTDHGDRFRHLTARRLSREKFFKDARLLYPELLRPAFDHYVNAWRRGHDAMLPKAERAAALWDAAQMHRKLGIELFGYEAGPDFAVHDGWFEQLDFAKLRAKPEWLHHWEEDDASPERRANARPLLPPTRTELSLIAQTAPKTDQRFHYRYDAADLAWEAAELMPDNDPHTAEVLCIAGGWLKLRDPKSADRFYQALVSRCSTVRLAQEADQKRWFPEIPWDYNPEFK
jgi:hypothetical protein